jgi:hypothetical protein
LGLAGYVPAVRGAVVFRTDRDPADRPPPHDLLVASSSQAFLLGQAAPDAAPLVMRQGVMRQGVLEQVTKTSLAPW